MKQRVSLPIGITVGVITLIFGILFAEGRPQTVILGASMVILLFTVIMAFRSRA